MDAEAPTTAFDPGLTGQSARPVEGIDNGYLAGYRVRFDEAGPDGHMRTAALLRYAQDVAWRHSEQLGFDRSWYQARGLGWVVRGVELELHNSIPMGHTLRVSTAVVGHRRIWARRLGECRLADGRLAARVTTDWVLLDERNRIVRIPDDFGIAFANPEVRDEILRVPPPEGLAAHVLELSVRLSDLDPLDHVNNAVYVDWLEEALDGAGWQTPVGAEPAGGEPSGAEPSGAEPAAPDSQTEATSRTLRLEYLASAERGNQVVVELHGDPDAWSARIRRSDGLELVRATGSAPTP